MTLTKLIEQLQATGLPVIRDAFPASTRPDMPFITYSTTARHAFYADGEVLWYVHRLEIILYTSEKNADAEALLAAALNGCTYTWTETRNTAQACYEIHIITEV